MAKMEVKYKVVGNKVIEKNTKQVIKECETRKEAVKLVSRLIAGAGFDGNTPNFFCIPVKVR